LCRLVVTHPIKVTTIDVTTNIEAFSFLLFNLSFQKKKQLFGFAYGGPFGHLVHKVLDSIFKGKRDKKTVAKKVQKFMAFLGNLRV
jgi:hypothetical protein